jgi:hypothetical protein
MHPTSAMRATRKYSIEVSHSCHDPLDSAAGTTKSGDGIAHTHPIGNDARRSEAGTVEEDRSERVSDVVRLASTSESVVQKAFVHSFIGTTAERDSRGGQERRGEEREES